MEKMPSASSGGPASQQRKENESSVASGSGQPHPHTDKKKPTTKAERRAQQVGPYLWLPGLIWYPPAIPYVFPRESFAIALLKWVDKKFFFHA